MLNVLEGRVGTRGGWGVGGWVGGDATLSQGQKPITPIGYLF